MLNEILRTLHNLGQPQLGDKLETLSLEQQAAFFEQLKNLSHALLKQQRALLHSSPQKIDFTPVTQFTTPDISSFQEGERKLKAGKAATLILAGGQGSRLGSSQPKALIPVTLFRKKTFLQLLCEKTHAASLAYSTPLSIALMTSPLNHDVIKSYLEAHRYFGLSPDQVDLFTQGTAPFLNDQESWFLEAPGKISAGPDGNGHSLKKLSQAGIAKKWQEKGIEIVSIQFIDNPLANPFDATLCGYHTLQANDITIKAILRKDEEEKVGLLVYKNGRIAVQEYTEASFPNPAPLAYIGLLCLNLSFLQQIASLELPWHLARKQHGGQMVWKYERFLFDILPLTDHTGVVVFPREDIYAPLKNLSGPHSLATVQQALLNFDRRLFHQLTELPLPDRPFELDPKFYYSTPSLKAAWKNKLCPPEDYIS